MIAGPFWVRPFGSLSCFGKLRPRHTLQAGVYLYLGSPSASNWLSSSLLRSAQKDTASTATATSAWTVAPLPLNQTYLVQDGFGLRATSLGATSATIQVYTR